MNFSGPSTPILFWDIDGTLVATAPTALDRHVHASSLVLGYQAQSAPPGPGKTDRQVVIEILESSGVEPTSQVLEAVLKQLDVITQEELNESPVHPLPGVENVLRTLSEHGAKHMLLTGNTPARARSKVTSAGLEGFFASKGGFYGASAQDRFEVAAAARRSMGHQDGFGRQRILVVLGDTPLDVRAGRHAGMLTVAIATGSHGYHELKEELPDLTLRDLVTEEHLLISYVLNLMG